MLTLSNISKTFDLANQEKLTVLNDVTLTLLPKENYAIQGPSGSGKSTLLSIMAGLERPTTGTIEFNNVDITETSEHYLANFRARNVGFVFQSFNLLQHFNAVENVLVAAEISGIKNPIEATNDAIEMVGMSHRKGHFPFQLSGGEQQRIAIARAIVSKPRLLFCDEPTGNLDTENGKKILDILLNIQSEIEAALVLVTHDNYISSKLKNQIKINGGRITL